MNETDYQNRAYEVLANLMPTFSRSDIKCQGSFSLKFGRHNVIVDGKNPSKYANRAIFDLLIYINDEPLILLELKRPGLALTDEDIKQGISYARLTEKITPITIISNGTDHLLYDTLKNEPFEASVIDSAFLDTIKKDLTIAGSKLKDSLEVLIQGDRAVFIGIINSITQDAFERLTGRAQEFSKPIIKDFNVPRASVPLFINKIAEKNFMLLTGDAFIGKTTFLQQFYSAEKDLGNATLYIDCQETFYNIFRKIALFVSAALKYPIDESKIREWLLLNFAEGNDKKITVIFDNLRFDCDKEIQRHIEELKDIFQFSGQRIVLCSDTSNYKAFLKQKGRTTLTMIGTDFFRFRLSHFSTEEYLSANDIVVNQYKFGILKGGSYSREYRTPRIWRLLINDFLSEEAPEGTIAMIDSVPNVSFLELFRNNLYFDPQMISDFRKFTEAFVNCIPELNSKPELHLMAYNLGIVPEDFALEHLDNVILDRLTNSGFIERRLVGDYEWVYVPKLPELIAGYAGEFILKKFRPLLEQDIDKGYTDLLATCEYFPYGEMVAATFLFELGQVEKSELFSLAVSKLMHDEPTIEISDSEKELALYYEGVGKIRVKSEQGVLDKSYGNTFPYLVLAHLTYLNFGNYAEDPHMIRFGVIGKIGNSEFLQRRADYIFFHDGISTLSSDDSGDFAETHLGILEPIILSMKMNFIDYPAQFKKLYDVAFTRRMYHLLHRMYIAAVNTRDFGSKEVVEICDKIISDYLSDTMFRIFAYIDTGSNAPRSEFRSLYKAYKKAGKRSK